jgi:hypothetical protein
VVIFFRMVKHHGLNFPCVSLSHSDTRGRSDRDRMVVGFITTYEISAYNDSICEFEPLICGVENPGPAMGHTRTWWSV